MVYLFWAGWFIKSVNVGSAQIGNIMKYYEILSFHLYSQIGHVFLGWMSSSDVLQELDLVKSRAKSPVDGSL